MRAVTVPDGCNFRVSTFAPGLAACTHPAGEGAGCAITACPLITPCPECDDWRRIRETFGYCVRFYGFRTSSDGCLKETVS